MITSRQAKIAPQTNPDSRPRSEPTLKLHSRATSSEGITSPSQHRKQFLRKADKKKKPFAGQCHELQRKDKVSANPKLLSHLI